MNKFNKEELNKILIDGEEGQRADLSGVKLIREKLIEVKLIKVDLSKADLYDYKDKIRFYLRRLNK